MKFKIHSGTREIGGSCVVEISISDNGVGMNYETCKKLFDISTNITSPSRSPLQNSAYTLYPQNQGQTQKHS